MMPMGSDFAGHDGELSDEHIKYYELRARGCQGVYQLCEGKGAGYERANCREARPVDGEVGTR